MFFFLMLPHITAALMANGGRSFCHDYYSGDQCMGCRAYWLKKDKPLMWACLLLMSLMQGG